MGRNNDGKWQGQHIYNNHKAGNPIGIKWVGRGNKLDGLNYFIENDIKDKDNKWKKQKYEYSCKDDKPDNGNWFSVKEFIQAVGEFIE